MAKKVTIKRIDEKPVKNTGEASHPDPGEMPVVSSAAEPRLNFLTSYGQLGTASQTDFRVWDPNATYPVVDIEPRKGSGLLSKLRKKTK